VFRELLSRIPGIGDQTKDLGRDDEMKSPPKRQRPKTIHEMIEDYEWGEILLHLETQDGMREIREQNASPHSETHVFPLTLSQYSHPVLPIHRIELYVPDPPPSEVFIAMINAYPDSLLICTKEGYYALHLAIMAKVELSVIRWMIKFRPQVAEHACARQQHNLPLHMACAAENRVLDVELVHILLEAHPWAVMSQNDQGRLPIHLACISKIGNVFVKERCRFPEAFVSQLNGNPNKLRQIFLLLLKTTSTLLLPSPSASSVLQSSDSNLKANRNRNEFLLSLGDDDLFLSSRDDKRDLLEAHIWALCAYQFDPRDLERIFLRIQDSHPDIFLQQTLDVWGDTPLHVAAMAPAKQTDRHPPPRLKMARTRGVVEDEATSIPTSTLEVVLFCAPSAVRQRNFKGELPLHLALGIGEKTWFPTSSTEFSASAVPPGAGTSWHGHGVAELVRAFPESAAEVHPVSKLYPFMLAACRGKCGHGEGSCFDTTFELLRRFVMICNICQHQFVRPLTSTRSKAGGQKRKREDANDC
jgi:hypothetical protein